MSNHAPSPETVVEVVIDAIELGEVKAAEKHNISRPTVSRYKRLCKEDPTCRDMLEITLQVQRTSWAAQLGRVKSRVLEHLEKLALKSEDVQKVNQVFKTLSENFVAETIMASGATMKPEGSPEIKPRPRPAEQDRRALREAAERGNLLVVNQAPETKQ